MIGKKIYFVTALNFPKSSKHYKNAENKKKQARKSRNKKKAKRKQARKATKKTTKKLEWSIIVFLHFYFIIRLRPILNFNIVLFQKFRTNFFHHGTNVNPRGLP